MACIVCDLAIYAILCMYIFLKVHQKLLPNLLEAEGLMVTTSNAKAALQCEKEGTCCSVFRRDTKVSGYSRKILEHLDMFGLNVSLLSHFCTSFMLILKGFVP